MATSPGQTAWHQGLVRGVQQGRRDADTLRCSRGRREGGEHADDRPLLPGTTWLRLPCVSDKPRVLANSSNIPLYLLCFAAGNPAGAPVALKIANHLLTRGVD